MDNYWTLKLMKMRRQSCYFCALVIKSDNQLVVEFVLTFLFWVGTSTFNISSCRFLKEVALLGVASPMMRNYYILNLKIYVFWTLIFYLFLLILSLFLCSSMPHFLRTFPYIFAYWFLLYIRYSCRRDKIGRYQKLAGKWDGLWLGSYPILSFAQLFARLWR